MYRRRGMAVGADERPAGGANFAGSSANDARIFTDKYCLHRRIEWLEHIANLKLPVREKRGLNLLPMQFEKSPKFGTHGSSQIERQDRALSKLFRAAVTSAV